MNMMQRLSDLPGVIVRDIVRYRRAFAHSGSGFRSDRQGWISLCNRIERLIPDSDGPGMCCDWLWGSALHAPSVIPSLGHRIMQASLQEWPIVFADRPIVQAGFPCISFIFAHAGLERLPQLKRAIRSIYAQIDVPCEVVVVDQSPEPIIGGLPTPIIYRHLERPAGSPFHKTWLYNAGARLARSPILVFHDGDVCVPELYANELLRAFARGFGAASLQRFLYYLGPADTARTEVADRFLPDFTPQLVFQNWKGGTIAITRDAFAAIGGYDEEFIGWGGEDAEFYDRCAEVGHCRSGYLPFVHLWHPPQPSKSGAQRDANIDFFRRRMDTPRRERIARLRGNA